MLRIFQRSLSHHIAIRQSGHADTYKLKAHSLVCPCEIYVAVKIPRVSPGDPAFRAKLNQLLVQHEIDTFELASSCDPSLVYPIQVVHVKFGDDDSVVKAILTPWLEHGNVLNYVYNNPSVDRLALVKGLARCVQHVHSNGSQVRNLHPRNVMVKPDKSVMLIHVGMRQLETMSSTGYNNISRSMRFMSPEALRLQDDPEADGTPQTNAMDVYSFGITSYAIYCPEALLSCEFVQICERGHGHLQRPSNMDPTLWVILQGCMQLNPLERPIMTAVINDLNALWMP